jgi:hypothetical protein
MSCGGRWKIAGGQFSLGGTSALLASLASHSLSEVVLEQVDTCQTRACVCVCVCVCVPGCVLAGQNRKQDASSLSYLLATLFSLSLSLEFVCVWTMS